MEIEQPLFTLRPKFVPIVALLSQIPVQIIITLLLTPFCGIATVISLEMISFLLQLSGAMDTLTRFQVPGLLPFAIFALLFFFGVPIVGYLSKWRTYRKTEYRFFRTSLEYYEGFFTLERKIIDYQAIAEITVSEGPVQQKYGLGSLKLSTAATGRESGASRSGIRLDDIENPRTIYRKVRELMRTQRSA